MELHQLIQEFLLAKLAEQQSTHTVAWYDDRLLRFYRWLCAQDDANPVAVATIQAFYASRRARGLSAHTIHGDHRALRVFYKWLRDDRQLIATSPVEGVRMVAPKPPPPRRIAPADFRLLLDAIPMATWVDMRDRFLVTLLALSGVRVGEAVRLRIGDLDVTARVARVTGKTGSRPVPLLPPVIESFIAYVYARPPHKTGHLFLSARGDLSVRGIITTNGIRQMLRRRAAVARGLAVSHLLPIHHHGHHAGGVIDHHINVKGQLLPRAQFPGVGARARGIHVQKR